MLTDRFVGSLVGLAVGDALGAPVEGMSSEEISARYSLITDYVAAPLDRPEAWRLPGLHTGDTQQALIVTEAILETGRANPDVIVRKMIELSEGPRTVPCGAHRGAGRNFRDSLLCMRRDARWSSGSRNTAGIGASVRVAPVGLFFAGDDGAVRENATLSALVTHTDPRACLAACAIAYLAGQASRSSGRALPVPEVFQKTLAFVRRSEPWFMEVHGSRSHPDVRDRYRQFGDALAALDGAWKDKPQQVLPEIEERASALAGYGVGHPCRGFALAGVISAIYFFLRYPECLRDALLAAVNAGGDTNSVGAITGALCGAAGGESALAPEWCAGLRALEQIRLRALALAGQGLEAQLWRPLADLELELTLEEDRLRRAQFPPETFPEEYAPEEPPEPSQPEERSTHDQDERDEHRPGPPAHPRRSSSRRRRRT